MRTFSGRGLLAILVAVPLAAQTLPVVVRTLPNGMRIVMVERHDQPTIACGWVARVGSANETVGATGMAHLFEHMMFKGTKRIGTRNAQRDGELNDLQDRLKAEIRTEVDALRERQRRGELLDIEDPAVRSPRHQKLLEDFLKLVAEQRTLIVKDELPKVYNELGATGLNANTSPDRTFFHITVPANKLELWAWLEADRLQNAVFREFYSERDVVLEERRLRTDATPMGKIQEAFGAMSWEALPYRWPVIGWPSDITQVTREQANTFFKTYYAPNNLTAILVGDFKADTAGKLLERYFGSLPANPAGVPQMITTEPAQVAEQRMVAQAEANPMVMISYKSVSGIHKDAAALEVLASILSGASGRLNRSLVLENKAALGVQAGFYGMKYSGTFNVMAMPTPDQTPETLEPLLYAELDLIQRDGITERELLKVKNLVQASVYRTMEDNGYLRNALAEAESMGTCQDFLEAPQRLRNVTREDVRRVARAYLRPDNRNILIVHRKPAPVGKQQLEAK